MSHAPDREQHFATINGIQMHYAVSGSGPLVVLLHGFPDTHRSWDLQVPALVHAGYRVVTPDMRGYGSTDRPRDGYDVATLARDVRGLIEHLGEERAHLVGHDWGGAVAWEVATRHASVLHQLVVLNCPHPVRMAEDLLRDPAQRKRSWYMFFFQVPGLPEWWLTRNDGRNVAKMFRASSTASRRPPADLVEASRRALLEPDAARAAVAYYRAALGTFLHPLRAKRTMRSYASIEVPVTVLWGECDTALGMGLLRGTDRFASHLAIHRIPDAGHFVHQERPDEVNGHLIRALGAVACPS